ncbi:MAG: mechanosensitive ion channel [Pseudomonadales bacterium]
MEFIVDSFRADWESLLSFAPRLVYAVVVFGAILLAGRYLGRLTLRLLRGSGRVGADEQLLRSLVVLLSAGAGALLALGVLGLQGIATSLMATGGVVAIVLGFAFREIGENFLAGFFLTFSRPFERGDLIKTGDLTGTVRTIELRHVHIRTADACDVFVPSAQIFREPLYNYTRDGLRRPSFTIGVAYHDEPETVIARLAAAAATVSDVLADPAPSVAIKAYSASVIDYEVFFWVDLNASPKTLLQSENAVKLACWRALKDAGMTFSTDVTTGLEIKSVAPLSVRVEAT